MSLRHDFVLLATEPGANVAAACRAYGISRNTGYKWLKRFAERGVRGLEDMDRGPSRGPLPTTAEMALDVVAIRHAHPTWGARKLRAVLLRENPDNVDGVPSVRTIGRILKREGLVNVRKVRHRKSSPGKRPEVVVEGANDLWTVDFKGWWRTLSGKKAEPLTVRDHHSKLLFAVRLVSAPSIEDVQAVFIELFRRYGMPKAIQSDNGSPFAHNRGKTGLTKLSAWWVALGIRWVRSRVGCPQDNGGHERMHRDLKAEIQRRPSWSLKDQQDACDRWMHEFNHHRPHDALDLETPASVYTRSPRLYPEQPPELSYSPDFEIRRISKCGTLRYSGHQHHLSNALAGYDVGVEALEDMRFRIWFADRCLGVGKLPWDGSLRPPGPDVVAL